MIGALALGRGQPFIDLAAAQANVIWAEQRQGFGGCAIATCPPDLLVIGLDRLGQIRMRHPADIGLVHAHAERHGRHNDQAVFAREPAFYPAPRLGFHSAVIGHGRVPLCG